MVKLFASGCTRLVLALHLSDLGFPDGEIGLFMALSLVGNLLVSMVLEREGSRRGVKITVSVGCVLMVVTGVLFVIWDGFWVLLLASVVGGINPR